MSELHKFLFDGLPVRGMIVRLTDAWTEILSRRAANSETGNYAPAVRELRDTLSSLRAISRRLESNPSSYLLGSDTDKEFTP